MRARLGEAMEKTVKKVKNVNLGPLAPGSIQNPAVSNYLKLPISSLVLNLHLQMTAIVQSLGPTSLCSQRRTSPAPHSFG